MENAALAALDLVGDGMVLGLGSGSTAEIFIEHLGHKIAAGLKVKGVPTSKASEKCAKDNDVPLLDPDRVETIHLAVDGADEVDPEFQLIKGGGACLLREKIIANYSQHMTVIIDQRKMVEHLGAFPLPVEVDRFGVGLTSDRIYAALNQAGCKNVGTKIRSVKRGKKPLITDGGNFIIDCACKHIPDPRLAAALLSSVPGVIEHGLFIDLADTLILGEDDHAKVVDIIRD